MNRSVRVHHVLLGVVAVAALAGATRVAAEVDAVALATVVGALATAGVLIGVRANGTGRTRDWKWSWWLLAVGLGASAVGTIVAAAGHGPSFAGIGLDDALEVTGGFAALAGLLLLTRHRQSGRAVDVFFEAATAAVATGFLAWSALVGVPGFLDAGATTPAAALAPVLLDLAIVWIATRLIGMTDEHPIAYRYLVAAFVCMFTVDAVEFGALVGGAGAAAERIAPLQHWGYCLWAAAALHPALRTPFEPSTARTLGLSRAHMLFVGAAVLLPPAAYVLRSALGQQPDVTVVIAGSAILPLIVAVQLMHQVQARARGEYRAQHDALTGLPNRVLFQDRLDVALSHARRAGTNAAVMFLDLDRFKNINDSLGHDVGNELLRAVAKRLTRTLREQDTVARMGGDEFTILLSEVANKNDAGLVARKVLAAFEEPLVAGRRELFVSPSIGVAVFPDHGADAESLLKNADTAMYRAKAQGRNTFQVYTSDMSARAQVRLSLEHSLHDAIERGELSLHYQPQIDMVSGSIVGLEALARWDHPRLGQISPGAFIPLAEESGLIQPLGEWVLETAARQNQQWMERGLISVPVAVNVSARQFTGERLQSLVSRVLDETGLPAGLLELELTESVLVRDTKIVSSLLEQLKTIGVRCSIDDFGTGFSGLNYLAQLPVDTLKIDRSFVQSIGMRDVDATIVSAIIALAMSLGLDVIAEGVETDAQAAFLRDHGCRNVQGYLFSKPLAADDLEERLVFAAANRPPTSVLDALAAEGAPALSSGPHPSVGVGAPAIAELLLAVASNEDGGSIDPEVVAAVLAALAPDGARRDAYPWSTRVSVRVAAGTFAGLMPISSGLASAGALPPAVQNTASTVLGTIGLAVPRAVELVPEDAVLPPLLAARSWVGGLPDLLTDDLLAEVPLRSIAPRAPATPDDVEVLAIWQEQPEATAAGGDRARRGAQGSQTRSAPGASVPVARPTAEVPLALGLPSSGDVARDGSAGRGHGHGSSNDTGPAEAPPAAGVPSSAPASTPPAGDVPAAPPSAVPPAGGPLDDVLTGPPAVTVPTTVPANPGGAGGNGGQGQGQAPGGKAGSQGHAGQGNAGQGGAPADPGGQGDVGQGQGGGGAGGAPADPGGQGDGGPGGAPADAGSPGDGGQGGVPADPGSPGDGGQGGAPADPGGHGDAGQGQGNGGPAGAPAGPGGQGDGGAGGAPAEPGGQGDAGQGQGNGGQGNGGQGGAPADPGSPGDGGQGGVPADPGGQGDGGAGGAPVEPGSLANGGRGADAGSAAGPPADPGTAGVGNASDQGQGSAADDAAGAGVQPVGASAA